MWGQILLGLIAVVIIYILIVALVEGHGDAVLASFSILLGAALGSVAHIAYLKLK